MTRKQILDRAIECVTGEREQDYGSPESNFLLIARLWTAYCGFGFSAKDVAMMMSLLKIARIKNGGGSGDSYVDLAGYAACAGEVAEAQEAMDNELLDEFVKNKKGESVSDKLNPWL